MSRTEVGSSVARTEPSRLSGCCDPCGQTAAVTTGGLGTEPTQLTLPSCPDMVPRGSGHACCTTAQTQVPPPPVVSSRTRERSGLTRGAGGKRARPHPCLRGAGHEPSDQCLRALPPPSPATVGADGVKVSPVRQGRDAEGAHRPAAHISPSPAAAPDAGQPREPNETQNNVRAVRELQIRRV